MVGEYIIRKMNFNDIDQALEVEKLSFSTPWSRNSFEEELRNTSACYLVAVHNETMIGYAGMWLVVDEAHITNIAVHPAFRGLGLGKKLTLELINQAYKQGFGQITLEVRVSNLTARNMYKGLGFHEAGIRKGYYYDNNEDAVIMWKEIDR